MLNNKARQGLREAGIEPLTKKACVTATAQSVPWAKMATVPPWVVQNVLPTFLYIGRLAMNWKETFVYRGRLANFLGNLEGFFKFFLCPKKIEKKIKKKKTCGNNMWTMIKNKENHNILIYISVKLTKFKLNIIINHHLYVNVNF